MAKINRFAGNLQAFGSSATGTERTVFGDTVQSDALDDNVNSDFFRGWGIVGVNENPTKQDFNAFAFTATQLLSYIHQMGVPEWQAAQEFHTGSVTHVGVLGYVSVSDSNTGNNPDTDDGSNWAQAGRSIINGVAKLRDQSPVAGRLIELGYHTTLLGGGGGIFRGVTGAAAATYVDNGGTIVVPSGGDGSAAWVRVEGQFLDSSVFGTLGNRTADDLASIQAYIDAVEPTSWDALSAPKGEVVQLHAGTFRVTAPIVLPSYVTLKGEGPLATEIFLSNSTNTDVIKTKNYDTLVGSGFAYFDTNDVPYGFGIESLGILGNYDNNTSGGGIKIYGAGYRVRDVHVTRAAGTAFTSRRELDNATFVRNKVKLGEAHIENLHIRDCKARGIDYFGPTDAKLDGIYVGECWGDIGVNIESSIDVGLMHVYACNETAGGVGVRVQSTSRFENLITEHNYGTGLSVESWLVSISNLQMYRNCRDSGDYHMLVSSGSNLFQCANLECKIDDVDTGGIHIAGPNNLLGRVVVYGDNIPSTGTDISFDSATKTINSTSTDLSAFTDGSTVKVSGSSSNDGTYTLNGSPTATTITTIEALVNESAGASVTVERSHTKTGVRMAITANSSTIKDAVVRNFNDTGGTGIELNQGGASYGVTVSGRVLDCETAISPGSQSAGGSSYQIQTNLNAGQSSLSFGLTPAETDNILITERSSAGVWSILDFQSGNATTSDGTTGGAASAGAGNQYVELVVGGTTYKVLHDGTV